jgi:phage tail-like protein
MARLGLENVGVTSCMVDLLPAVLRTDDFAAAFVAGLDDVLAPIVMTIDGLANYVDPDIAPADFLAWLAAWFGVDVDPGWSEERTRATIKRFARLQLMRGTARGLGELVAALTGEPAEIDDGGGVWTTYDPGTAMQGTASRVVRISGPEPTESHRRVVQQFLPQGFRVSWD